MTVSITWDQVRDDKQAAREALIPAEWRLPQLPADTRLNVLDIPRESGLLTDTELEITETHARELIKRMVAKELTSEAVTTAFSKRAAIAHQVTNCLTEIFFEKGIARAKEIDAEYARTGVPAGELHGLPISLKDNINIEGYDSTMGFICEANKPSSARDEADVVTTLRAAGAVFYCKTNVPPGMVRAFYSVLLTADEYRDGQQCLGIHALPLQPRVHWWRLFWRRGRAHRHGRLTPRYRHRYWRLGAHSLCDQ
jgi:amidase